MRFPTRTPRIIAHRTNTVTMTTSFLETSPECHFPINNLPYGVFSTAASPNKRIGIAIATYILDLSAVLRHGLFQGSLQSETCFDQVRAPRQHCCCLRGCTMTHQGTLNGFLSRGPAVWADTRAQVTRLLSSDCPTLRDSVQLQQQVLVPQVRPALHQQQHTGCATWSQPHRQRPSCTSQWMLATTPTFTYPRSMRTTAPSSSEVPTLPSSQTGVWFLALWLLSFARSSGVCTSWDNP